MRDQRVLAMLDRAAISIQSGRSCDECFTQIIHYSSVLLMKIHGTVETRWSSGCTVPELHTAGVEVFRDTDF